MEEVIAEEELLHRIALSAVPELGPVRIRLLAEHFGSAVAVFRARKKEISRIEGIGEASVAALRKFTGFGKAEQEMYFIRQQKIQALFLTDKAYPKRLLHCADAPPLLFYKGTADLNTSRVISIIGTRSHTEYGKQFTEQLLQELPGDDIIVISGLASGIDAVAHRAAIKNQIPTIGVLAHGLDTVYPWQHRHLAREMETQGGLLTEYTSGTTPDKHHFPSRNRIVAGMADATIVVETAVKGGSMITAELAYSYNRDVFAVPGRLTDARSAGCLRLIADQKAVALISTRQLLETMGWITKKQVVHPQQKLFIELNPEEQKIAALLQKANSPMAIDEIYLRSGLSSSVAAAALLNMEIQQLVQALPGKRYAWI
jgi:DNA processing protein